MAANVLEIAKGADYSSVFTVVDEAGAVVDLTGATVTAYLRHPFSHETLEPVISIGILDAVNGSCSIAMDKAETLKVGCGCVQEMVISVLDGAGLTHLYLGANVEGL